MLSSRARTADWLGSQCLNFRNQNSTFVILHSIGKARAAAFKTLMKGRPLPCLEAAETFLLDGIE
jgi:hypothetical protein